MIIKSHLIFTNSNRLFKVSLVKCNLISRHIKEISVYLSNNKRVQILNLSHNYIDCSGMAYLSDALKNNKTLKQLNLTSNKIRDEGFIDFSEFFKHNSTLEILNLNYNTLGDAGKYFFKKMIKSQINYLSFKSPLLFGTIGFNSMLQYSKFNIYY